MYKTTSKLIASAKFYTKDAEGNVTETEVSVGDVLSNVVLDGGRETITIDSANVVGFIPRPRKITRGGCSIVDNVPSVIADPDGGGRWGTVEETLEVRAIVVDVQAEDNLVRKVILVDRIESIGGGSSEDEGGDDDGEGD